MFNSTVTIELKNSTVKFKFSMIGYGLEVSVLDLQICKLSVSGCQYQMLILTCNPILLKVISFKAVM